MPQDPRERGPKPPHPEQQQDPPGLESEMHPKPDYGEDTYKGSGKLKGKAAIITGGDSGIGRAVALAFAREGADVLISYLSEDSDAKEIATRLSCRSHRGWCHSLNANHENLFSSKICTISIEISIALLGAKTSEV